MEYITYKKFKSASEAEYLIEILENEKIEYYLDDIAPTYDITFTGGTDLEDKVALKVKQEDFSKIDKLLEEDAETEISSIDENHYLYQFSDDELVEILENFDDWGQTDYLLAQKILKDRGKEFSKDKIQKLKTLKIEKLKKPEKGNTGWFIFGFISAFLGGLFGILIGYHHYNFRKKIITGERVFAYDEKTRKQGFNMFILGIISLIFWIFYLIVTK